SGRKSNPTWRTRIHPLPRAGPARLPSFACPGQTLGPPFPPFPERNYAFFVPPTGGLCNWLYFIVTSLSETVKRGIGNQFLGTSIFCGKYVRIEAGGTPGPRGGSGNCSGNGSGNGRAGARGGSGAAPAAALTAVTAPALTLTAETESSPVTASRPVATSTPEPGRVRLSRRAQRSCRAQQRYRGRRRRKAPSSRVPARGSLYAA